MKKKILGIFVCMLLIATTVLPVAGTINGIKTELKKENFTGGKEGLTTTDGDWWPMFRHDPGNTGCSLSIAPNTNLLSWKQMIGDDIFSAVPVVFNDRLYLSTGWYYGVIDPPNMTKTSMFEGPSLSKILKDITTYNEEYFGGVYCLDADTGTQLWDYPMYAPNDPAVVDDKVYVTDLDLYSYFSSLYCLDAETGDEIWQKPMDSLVLSPTIVADDKIYLGCLDIYGYYGTVKCLDLEGNSVWTHSLPPYEIMWFSAPAVYDGKAYFITSDIYSYYYGKLYCLNAETGEYIWSKPVSSWLFWFGLPSPVCADGKVLTVDFDLYSFLGYLKCFDADTGDPIWTYNMGSVLSSATSAVCQDSVFITALDFYSYYNWLYRIDLEDGTLIWKVPIPGFTYWFSSSSPVCSEYSVFVCPMDYYGYSSTLYCRDIEDGSPIWDYDLDYETLTAPSIADERVYIADYMGNIYAFEDELKIGKISGGLLSIKAEIKNIGESDFTDVSWTISVRGGIFDMIDQYWEGTISLLPGGDKKIARAFPVLGLGKVEIEVTVTMPGLNVIKKTFVIVLS